jgi:hypothetical protein
LPPPRPLPLLLLLLLLLRLQQHHIPCRSDSAQRRFFDVDDCAWI